RIELAVTDARRHADTLAEIREIQHAADHAAVEGFALVGIHRVAHTEHAADVEHLQDVAGLHALGHVARIAEQRLAMAERAGNDVALAHLGHASAGELERVVGGLVGQDLDDHDHTFLGGNVVGGDTHLVTQATGLRHRCNLVDDYRTHLTYLQHGHGTCPSTKRSWRNPVRPAGSIRPRLRRTRRARRPSANAAIRRLRRTNYRAGTEHGPC